MSAHNESTGRIETGAAGLGEASDADIRKRAADLAVQEGLPEDTPGLYERARQELQASTTASSPDDEAGIRATSGNADEALGDQGRKILNRSPGNEENVVRELTEEGVEEAAHQQRTEAEREALKKEQGL